MGIPLRILLVEDSENDALLVLEELRSGGIEPTWERVETAAAMMEALEHRAWDIVIADYALPRFSGMQALSLVRERDPNMPLILISGQLSEEQAVEAMRAGARDFISKRNMSRLAPAVEREVQESRSRRERKAAEEALKAEQEHRLEFYRRTISAATAGKLVIADCSEIERLAGPPAAVCEISTPEEIKSIRSSVHSYAEEWGMETARIGKLVTSVGEAVTNVVKHAQRGVVSIHRLPEGMMVVVSDKGPGIPALALPEVALRKGYSTAGTLGMGYKVMISFADKVYLATGVEGTTVALEMGFRPPAAKPFGLDTPYMVAGH